MRPLGSATRTLPVLTLLLLASCGHATQESSATAGQHASTAGAAGPSSPASSYVAPIKTMGPSGLQDARPTRLGLPEFEQAMAAYCTDYYTGQRDAEEKYLGSDRQAQLDFARANAANARRTERQLTALTPPKKLDAAFTGFLDSTHRITVAREGMLASVRSSGQEGMAATDLENALTERWALATQLHAPLCDGKLPPSQAAAAVAVAREWATSTDPVAACSDLVSPWILEDQATCVHIRTLENTPPYALPDDIDVVSVTGVEELTATVTYLKVGGCSCGRDGLVRLFFVDGAWLVNQSEE